MNTLSLSRLKKVIKNSKRIAPLKWRKSLSGVSIQNYINYVYDLNTNGFILRTKSVVNDSLTKHFPEVKFIESETDLDHAGDIDYLGFVGKYAFGIQIKPITAKANFGNYSISERMKKNFIDFEKKYKGRVFIIFSLDGEISNKEVIKIIAVEIRRLKNY